MVQGKSFSSDSLQHLKMSCSCWCRQFQLWSICTHINLKLTLFYSS